MDHKNQYSHPGDIDYPIFPSNFCKDILFNNISLVLCKYFGYSEYMNMLCLCQESYKFFNQTEYIVNFFSKFFLEDNVSLYANKIQNDEETFKNILYMIKVYLKSIFLLKVIE